MKPYGREKNVRFPGKTDCHPKKVLSIGGKTLQNIYQGQQ